MSIGKDEWALRSIDKRYDPDEVGLGVVLTSSPLPVTKVYLPWLRELPGRGLITEFLLKDLSSG